MNINNYQLREQLKQHDKLREELTLLHGNVLPDLMEEMIDVLGGDFEICLKLYHGDRKIITLNELLVLENIDNKTYDDIREVFIINEDYKELFEIN